MNVEDGQVQVMILHHVRRKGRSSIFLFNLQELKCVEIQQEIKVLKHRDIKKRVYVVQKIVVV